MADKKPAAAAPSNPNEIYCVKCKAKREAKNIEQVTMKNGRPASKGICTVCGTTLFRIGGGKKKEESK